MQNSGLDASKNANESSINGVRNPESAAAVSDSVLKISEINSFFDSLRDVTIPEKRSLPEIRKLLKYEDYLLRHLEKVEKRLIELGITSEIRKEATSEEAELFQENHPLKSPFTSFEEIKKKVK